MSDQNLDSFTKSIENFLNSDAQDLVIVVPKPKDNKKETTDKKESHQMSEVVSISVVSLDNFKTEDEEKLEKKLAKKALKKAAKKELNKFAGKKTGRKNTGKKNAKK